LSLIFISASAKRSRPSTSKSSKNNQTIKRSRLHRHSQPNNQLMTIIQSYQTIDPNEDLSFDFFDIDTTFSDRLFTDTTTSEKYIYFERRIFIYDNICFLLIDLHN